jgi:chorismate-pyruvate lyase
MSQPFNLLYPLDTFYLTIGRPLPTAVQVDAEEIPEPYHRLLVPRHDMTPTLEAFHRDKIHLRVLDRRVADDALSRLVVLVLNEDESPVEFGAIVIYLKAFPEAARQSLLEGYQPLGTILADHAIPHSSCPQAFLRLTPDPYISGALNSNGSGDLYGRRNVLLAESGDVIADIIEILPWA